jgi:hypothetical protein
VRERSLHLQGGAEERIIVLRSHPERLRLLGL